MDETKATYTGLIGGAVAGYGLAAVGTLAIPGIGPFLATYIVIGGMVGGALAGGNAGLKIAEKVNHKKKDQEV